MTIPSTVLDAINSTARNPSQVQVKGTMVTAQNIDAQIKADQYIKSQSATTASAGFGVRFASLKPPGAG